MAFKANQINFLSVVFLSFMFLYVMVLKRSFTQKERERQEIETKFFSKDTYTENCIDLYTQLSNPNMNLVYQPPLKYLNEELEDLLKQNLTSSYMMPIKCYEYHDDSYPDATSHSIVDKPRLITNKEVNYWSNLIKKHHRLMYDDLALKNMMLKYSTNIKDKNVIILGAQAPWVEALALELNASNIVTLENTRKMYENEKLKWFHTYDYLKNMIREETIENLDIAISFSTLEHAGLGRYGEPLGIYDGDVNLIRQIHCMLKPGSFFFLGLQMVNDDYKYPNGYIEFNSRRVYGTNRLKLLFQGWHLIDEMESKNFFNHKVFVLQKF
jgi:hypothetical protein